LTTAWGEDVEVVIAGGGPAGLAAAIELGRRGVRVLILEPRATVSMDRPRAKTTSIRTMEHLRRWGLADRLREVAPLPVAWSQETMFATTVLGREITRFYGCLGLSPDRRDEYAESGQQVPQPLVEQVFREAIDGSATVTLATGWTLTSVVQHEDAVTVFASDNDGNEGTVRAVYLLGCDGATSVTRHAVGAFFEGSTDGRPNFSMVFRSAALGALVPHRPAIHHWVLDPAVPGLVGRMNLSDTWWAMVIGVSAEDGDADPIRLIRAQIGPGGEDVDIEMVSTDSWTARMLNANTYRVGRVFLVGDAAHLNPPWGGHGFNTAVGDAVNLGWKLAAMLGGWGGPSLLDSYEAERKPIAQQTIELATRNMSKLSTNFADPMLSVDGPEGDACRAEVAAAIQATKHAEFHSLGLVLGYHYGSSPLTIGDGTPDPAAETSTYTPSFRPGSRLPHCWLADGRSVYDALGPEFTLLIVDADADPRSVVGSAAQRAMPLQVVSLLDGGPAADVRAELYGSTTMLLVRPDQHIAWRTSARSVAASEIAAVLSAVTGH
jgi:2-polyprenyl-6-methoxyphenol hydroxylase-like FAD-dependent oxidoreductase